jgi:4-diphosphocytidyl-2-C-methyl-D-erythritol kinase
MADVSVKAFAKVNLSLEVTGRLENGYHLIRSVMQAIDIYDDISVAVKGNAGLYGGTSIKLNVKSEADADSAVGAFTIPSGEDNIMYRAAAAMSDYFCPAAGNKIHISILKRIPVSAGLAGGSSDAAAVMLALARLWNLNAELSVLLNIGKSIGADVPFCIAANAKLNSQLGFADDAMASSAAFAEGIGEALTPLAGMDGALVLVKPDIAVSTARIYGLLDEHGFSRERQPAETVSQGNMINALEPITVGAYPAVGETIEKVKAIAAPNRVFMSGSGPTVIAYFSERAEAERAADRIKQALAEGTGGGYYVRLAKLI